MADQADVESALAAIVANALYPNGTGAASVIGAECRVYRGFPTARALDADLSSGVLNVSVSSGSEALKNVTRYPRQWQVAKPVAQLLSVAVSGQSATFSGTCALGQLAGVIVNDTPFPYAVQASDSLATVASNLAALIRAGGWIVNYAASTVSVPNAERFVARVVTGVGAMQEIRRQVQDFKISIWCPDPAIRDAALPVIDLAMAELNFIPLADGSYGRIRFVGEMTEDSNADAYLYRRDLIYSVEYPTTLTQMTPAMLFGSVAATVDTVLLEKFIS
jgi:hypothetical protein